MSDTKTSAAQEPGPSPAWQVTCPICLSRLDWSDLPHYTWDETLERYVELKIPDDASPEQQARMLRNASVRCPNPGEQMETHFLPAAYGRYGPPAVFGFVGASRSGKTHLLTAIVGAIEQGELMNYGIRAHPLDLARHQRFLATNVEPFLQRSVRLSPTGERIVNFVDAFLITGPTGETRPVTLFDVAGEELKSVGDTKRFLEIADALLFVVDPAQFGSSRAAHLGDPTFNTVLDLLQSSSRLSRLSAAVVLNKADLIRFDDPIALWLRREIPGLDPEETLRESADVYAYLHRRGAQAWTRPYRECHKATLHVASSTGVPDHDSGDAKTYPRQVSPRRVLGPLVALLAMTGVLSTPETGRVGI